MRHRFGYLVSGIVLESITDRPAATHLPCSIGRRHGRQQRPVFTGLRKKSRIIVWSNGLTCLRRSGATRLSSASFRKIGIESSIKGRFLNFGPILVRSQLRCPGSLVLPTDAAVLL